MRFLRFRILALAVAMWAGLTGTAWAAFGDGRSPRGGKGYFTIGWTQLDVDPLNDALAPRGYTRFSGNALSLGGAGHTQFGRFVLGGQGQGSLVRSRQANLPSGPFRTRLRSGAGFVDLGAIALQTRRFTLTPLVGLGGGATVLQAIDLGTNSFDAATDDPRLSSELVRGAFLIDLGAMADVFIPRFESETRRGGFVLGMRAGYVLAPAESDWKFDNRSLSGGPDGVLTGPYVRFLIGGGGWR